MTRLTRRGLLRKGAAAGVLAASGLSLQAETRRGGRLRVGLAGADPTDGWDGRRHNDIFMQAAGQGAVFDTLTEVRADGTLVGELAESWEASTDARSWIFNLRRGVTFHNGKPFGADDVIQSLQLHVAPGSDSAARPIVAAMTEIKKLGSHQVQFTLATGNADLPYLLSDYHLLIYPAGQIDLAMAQGIGTGLYRAVRFEPGVRFIGKRVDSHYKDGKAGWFDEVEFIALNDARARMHALETGQVDAINRVDLADTARVSNNPALRLIETTGNRHFTFPMRSGSAPFDDVNLRRALKYGIDRQDMVDRVLLGHGHIGNDSPIGPANQYFAADLAQLPYDPDKAAFYLAKAGLTSLNIDLTVSTAAFDSAVDAARLYQGAARSAGIHINVVDHPPTAYWAQVWRNTPFCAGAWSGRATEDWMFATAYASGAPWNESQWEDKRFQQLLLAARSEIDSGKRNAMYGEMQMMLRDDGGVVIPMFANWVEAVSSRITTPDRIGGLWGMDNARMAERWSAV